jgi:hypothetical protein
MVRKTLAISLLLLLAFSTSGMTVKLHYCLGRLHTVGVGFDPRPSCLPDEMEEMPGCCTNDEVVVSIDEDFAGSGYHPAIPAPLADDLWDVVAYPVPSFIQKIYPPSSTEARGSPPRSNPFAHYLLFMVFRI